MPVQPAADLITLQMTGDLGGITYVQRAGFKRTSYAKIYPSKTPTRLQKYRRERFLEAINAWRALTNEQKKTLDDITNRYGMVMSGYNLYLSLYLTQHLDWLQEWLIEMSREW